ncbi:MAG: four helix bundle protein [Planctomycetota bacterium]|jgi:four helix bundle protein
MTKMTSRQADETFEEPLGDDAAAEKKPYDLVDRTALFGESVIRFAKRVPRNVVTRPLIRQLVRAGTSVGANYCEADEGVSRKDFRNRVGICKKEAKETKYWSRMIGAASPELKEEARTLWREAHELHLIFATIFRKTRTEKS